MKWDNDAGVWQRFQVHLVLTAVDDGKGKKKKNSYVKCKTVI